MTEHYDALETREPGTRESELFSRLPDVLRKAMAAHYIQETELPMTEIAFLLGFSELSAFSRAGRHWFGRAPRALRKRIRIRG